MEDWPVASVRSKRALTKLSDTHHMHLLHAFDANGLVIRPADYQRKLEGAVLWVEFTMHHTEDADGIHNFRGDIKNINVLLNPVPKKILSTDMSLQERDPRRST